MMEVKTFCEDWKEALRIRVQPIVKAGKRKPTMTIIKIGDVRDGDMVRYCKEIGIIGDYYKIPTNSGITQEDLLQLSLQCRTDEVYIEEPLPDDFYNPIWTWEYAEKGILYFLKSQNIHLQGQKVIVGLLKNGCTIECGDIVLSNEDIDLLEKFAVLNSCIDNWMEEND